MTQLNLRLTAFLEYTNSIKYDCQTQVLQGTETSYGSGIVWIDFTNYLNN